MENINWSDPRISMWIFELLFKDAAEKATPTAWAAFSQQLAVSSVPYLEALRQHLITQIEPLEPATKRPRSLDGPCKPPVNEAHSFMDMLGVNWNIL